MLEFNDSLRHVDVAHLAMVNIFSKFIYIQGSLLGENQKAEYNIQMQNTYTLMKRYNA
jgi:hypothetical protein